MTFAPLLAAAATVLAVSSGAAAATAAPAPDPVQRVVVHTLTVPDARGDVWTFSDVSGPVPASEPAVDVLRARVTHGAHGVGIRLVSDDLRRTGIQWYYCDVHVAGLTHRYVIEVRRGPGVAYEDVEGEWVRTPAVAHRIDYASDVVTVRIPRRLLGDPPWVRVRVRHELGVGDGVFFTDSPGTSGPTAVYTPRVGLSGDAASGR